MAARHRWIGAKLFLVWAGIACAQTDGGQRWAFATQSSSAAGNIISSPTTATDGTIYFGTEIGTATSSSPSGQLFALRPDGTQRWVYATPDWIDSTPAVGADGTVYFGCWDGKLYALNPDGTLKWWLVGGSYIASSPAIGPDDTIYVGTGDGDLMAVSPDGTLRWMFSVAEGIDASPAIAPDGTIYVGSWDGTFYAVRPDGTEKWHYTTGGDIVGSAAIAADGIVYFGSRDLSIYALNAGGELQWSAQLGDPIDSAPALGADGTLYVTTTGGRLFALDRNGIERWRYPAAGQPALNGIYSSPAVRRDGVIVFGSSNEALYGLNADGTLKFKTVLGDWADSSPLVTGEGSIFIGCSDKKLYSLSSAAGLALHDWPQFQRSEQRDGRQPIGSVAGTTGQLVNLSIRTIAGAEADTLIVGFYVNGTGDRNLMLRGIGPTLSQFNLSGFLPNPRLTAYSGSTVIGRNDNWDATDPASVVSTAATLGAFPLPAGSLDAVLLRNFSAGGYTVHVNDVGGTTGLALMELYDAGGAASARLSNLSARSAITPGAGVLIAGFIITNGPRAVLMRGIGPALGLLGLQGSLADTRLQVFRNAQFIAENDDWDRATNAGLKVAASAAVAAFPLSPGSKDAVLLLTLPPGAYTAQVSGPGTASGVGLVEVFELP